MFKTDITIVGAGYVGITAALILNTMGFKVAIIEKGKISNIADPSEPSRLLALASSSCEIFKKYGIINSFNEIGQPIKNIEVLEEDVPTLLEFNSQDTCFGHMVEERNLKAILIERLRDSQIKIYENAEVISIGNGVVQTQGMSLTADLVIGADGNNSFVRKLLGIATVSKDYNQFAIVCDLEHKQNHNGTAYEKFLPSGPFAILPKLGGTKSSIVWTVTNEYWKQFETLDFKEQEQAVCAHATPLVGATRVTTKLKAFPLKLIYAKKYFDVRAVLVGDAAHAIHPLAGQGLNLSIRDVAVLCEAIKEQNSLGLDIGSSIMLEKYQSNRKCDNVFMIEATHSINSIFAIEFLPVKFARRLGMKLINHFAPIKNRITKYASGY